jgi:protein-tyrosine-phosphatase
VKGILFLCVANSARSQIAEARKLGVSKEDLRLAVETARAVKDSPAQSILALADKYLGESRAEATPCCGGAKKAPRGGKCRG